MTETTATGWQDVRVREPASPAAIGMDHRWGNRTRVDVPVQLDCCGTTVAGRVRNISISGAYIETPLRLPALTVVNLRIGAARGSNLPVGYACGYVVRHDARGVAIEWCEEALLQASG